jgi:F1F0 ATPase subunit 2
MSEGFLLGIAFVGGAANGAFFYGGLWWTVRRVPRARRPGVLLLVSFAVRLGVALPAIYLVSAGGLGRLALCMAGLLIARVALVRILGPSARRSRRTGETSDPAGGAVT